MKLSIDIEKKFSGFSLQFATTVEGPRTGIFGPSGSGKSTLVSILSGLQQPQRGEITIDGECLFSSCRNINLAPEKRRISIVFQQSMLFPHMSVRSNILYGYRRCRSAERRIHPDALIELLKLQPLLERDTLTLSGGERQRVALARAVLANPRLLLMDEPLSALDDTLRFQIIPYLKSVSTEFGIPYLFISHSLVEMQLMADRAIVMENGRIREETTPDRLARKKMGASRYGYQNLMRFSGAEACNGMYACRWGGNTIFVSEDPGGGESLFELSSREIILFRKNPEAISARNLLQCTVTEIFLSDGRIGVELTAGGETLVAEIVPRASEELALTTGSAIFAAIKASSFRRLS
ncbi:MAG: molybdenum ABC transporter ATP-binding protein [Chlorobiaceae bacterium]|nr:molybdenum ABC transporter ATP-binding protein [Chlorobiaceae bacterium]